MNSSKEYICTKEAAAILGIDRRVMKKIIDANAGKLHSTRLGNKLLVKKQKLYELIDNNTIIRY